MPLLGLSTGSSAVNSATAGVRAVPSGMDVVGVGDARGFPGFDIRILNRFAVHVNNYKRLRVARGGCSCHRSIH